MWYGIVCTEVYCVEDLDFTEVGCLGKMFFPRQSRSKAPPFDELRAGRKGREKWVLGAFKIFGLRAAFIETEMPRYA